MPSSRYQFSLARSSASLAISRAEQSLTTSDITDAVSKLANAFTTYNAFGESIVFDDDEDRAAFATGWSQLTRLTDRLEAIGAYTADYSS